MIEIFIGFGIALITVILLFILFALLLIVLKMTGYTLKEEVIPEIQEIEETVFQSPVIVSRPKTKTEINDIKNRDIDNEIEKEFDDIIIPE